MTKKKQRDYLSNKEMFTELMECQMNGKISDKLGKMFMLMANNYATKPNFSGYSYKDEMISSAILSCCVAVDKFDGSKSENPNPFAYFTQCIHNAFLQVLNKERRNQNIRDELLSEANLSPSFNYIERNSEGGGGEDHSHTPEKPAKNFDETEEEEG